MATISYEELLRLRHAHLRAKEQRAQQQRPQEQHDTQAGNAPVSLSTRTQALPVWLHDEGASAVREQAHTAAVTSEPRGGGVRAVHHTATSSLQLSQQPRHVAPPSTQPPSWCEMPLARRRGLDTTTTTATAGGAATTAAAAAELPLDLQPKVMAPHVAVRGEVARAELLQRRRARYDAMPSLEQLLEQRGVPAHGLAAVAVEMGRYHTLLPLEAFDDTAYEERTPHDWLARLRAVQATTQTHKASLASSALQPQQLPPWHDTTRASEHDSSDDAVVSGLRCRYFASTCVAGHAAWCDGVVVDWDTTRNVLDVVPTTTTTTTTATTTTATTTTAVLQLPRVCVYLRAEDPGNFAARVAAAYARRRGAEAVLCYELCVAAMPSDAQQSLDPRVAARIRDKALSTPRLRESEAHLDVQAALAQARAQYALAMSADLLTCSVRQRRGCYGGSDMPLALQEAVQHQQQQDEQPDDDDVDRHLSHRDASDLTTCATAVQRRARVRATPVHAIAPGRRTRFARIVRDFRQQSFLAHHARLGHLVCAFRAASNKLLSQPIFLFEADLEAERPLTPVVFDDLQSTSLREAAARARERWGDALYEHVKAALAPLTRRDEVHLMHYDAAHYVGSKTQQFLTSLTCEMRDVLRHLLRTNIEAFVRFIEVCGAYTVTVRGMRDVHVTPIRVRGGDTWRHDNDDNKTAAAAAVGGDNNDDDDDDDDGFGVDARMTAYFLRRSPYQPPPLFRISLMDEVWQHPQPQQHRSSSHTNATTDDNNNKADEAHKGDGTVSDTAATTTTPVAQLRYSTTTAQLRAMLVSLLERSVRAHGDIRALERRFFDFAAAADTHTDHDARAMTTAVNVPIDGLSDTSSSQHDVAVDNSNNNDDDNDNDNNDNDNDDDRRTAAATAHVPPLLRPCVRRIDAVLARVDAAMTAYLATFAPYTHVVALDVNAYMQRFRAAAPAIASVAEEVQRQLRLQHELLVCIPAEVDLGLVRVDCAELRRRLAAKCAQVASRVLDAMAARAAEAADDVDAQFAALHAQLMRPATTPEEVVATREFAKSLGEHVHTLQQRIAELREVHTLLERFQRPLSEDEFNKKWRAIGWPAQLDDAINQRLQELEEVKRGLMATMARAQDAFAGEVAALQQRIATYAQYTNYSRQGEIAADVRATLERIRRAREQANTFNTHETLFQLERTNYAAVHALSSDFAPYASLWLTVERWSNALAEWHAVPFTSIDAAAMEQRVGEDWRTMQKCARDARLTPDLVRIAERTRESIESFRPLVPTIKALRTTGMQARHWQQLSKEIGVDVQPDKTLRQLVDVVSLRLSEHTTTLQRIADVAAREHQIAETLRTMREQWADARLSLKPHKDTACYILAKDVLDRTQELLDDQTMTTQALGFSPFAALFAGELAAWEQALRRVQAVLDAWLTCQKSWLYLEPIFQSEDIARQLPAEHRRFRQVHTHWRTLTTRAHDVDVTMTFCNDTEHCVDTLRECNALLEVVERGLNQYLENKRAAFARFYFLSNDELLTILSVARDPPRLQPHFRKLFEHVARLEMRAPEQEMLGMYSHMDEYVPFVTTVLPRKYVESWLTEVEHAMKQAMRQQLEQGMRAAAAWTDTHDDDDNNNSNNNNSNSGDDAQTSFVLGAVGQVAIAVRQMTWTRACEAALRTHGSLAPYAPHAQASLMHLVEVVRRPLTHLQRVNLGALITIEVHARDLVTTLADAGVDSVHAFEWVSQLRSYWEGDHCVVRQVDAAFVYGGEYLGNTSRLVVTPLTDRIYLTLTGAMHMCLGGAPAGPAGTGKTETVKDLAKALAKQCVVFNCQEGMTYASMGKFFKGLAQAGAWACFDEFNRIDVEVLSVVAQQVSSLQQACLTRQYRIVFEGSDVLVDPTHAVFITMNPGYAGRTELPDNLKVLFRPVACMVPDYAMIAEIRLFSYGYAQARTLARKMVATFKLSSEQLSSQDHYDFGMRAVNTVISAAGLNKREHPDESEDVLLLRALRDSNAPKFLRDDLLLFDGIVSDLFPGVEVKAAGYGALVSALQHAAAAAQLQPVPAFVAKCLQLYEMSVLRHGQMTVGPTMGGKTSAMRVLQAALTRLRHEHDAAAAQPSSSSSLPPPSVAAAATTTTTSTSRWAVVQTHVLNPKSITMSQLYGCFDEVTGEWRDGLVGELFRRAAADASDTRHWIVFDGPVDALWIESMNTVLDDNKKLCLISGEIIAMTPQMNCWFEVEDLAVASPATVSRAGMIYMEPNTCVGVTPLVRNWHMYRLPPPLRPYAATLQELCERLFPSLVHFVQTQVVEYCPTVWPNLVLACFGLYEALLRRLTGNNSDNNNNNSDNNNNNNTMTTAATARDATGEAGDEAAAVTGAGAGATTSDDEAASSSSSSMRDVYLNLFLFAVVWSFGATGDKASRQRFDKFLRDELAALELGVVVHELPVIGCLQDYEYVVEQRRWVAWTERLPPFATAVTAHNMAELIVPTADVARYKYVNRVLLECGRHTLCCGPTGTGKTAVLQQLLLHDLPAATFTPLFVTFSARTSAPQTQERIVSKFEVRRRAAPPVYGAPVGKKFVLLVDDVNMPQKERYGAQPPLELLRHFFDHGGWYDARTRDFFCVADVLVVGAMAPPGGGRHAVSHRVLRHFHHIAFADVDEDAMRRIFGTLLEAYFGGPAAASAATAAPNTTTAAASSSGARPSFASDVRATLSSVVAAAIDVFHTVARELRPTPARPHYTFNLRDVSRVVAGVVSATPSSVPHAGALVRLWLHETMRTFRDRLTCARDRDWLDALLHTQLTRHFKGLVAPDELIATTSSRSRSDHHHHDENNDNDDDDVTEQTTPQERLLFTDALAPRHGDDAAATTTAAAAAAYREVRDMDALTRALRARLDEHNAQAATPAQQLPLVLFADAVQHVCRIARAIGKPCGHVLLLGVGGSGRQSLACLAACLRDMTVTRLEVSKGYTMNLWHEDVKAMLRRVGLSQPSQQSQRTLFVCSDTQMVHEAMLEDVNSLLNSGEVPTVFSTSELDEVLAAMRPVCVQEGVPLDKVNVYARFVRACRADLHIALCMSPLGEPFRARLRAFPSLVNCCTIDWFSAWPHQALHSVAGHFFRTSGLLATSARASTTTATAVHDSSRHGSSTNTNDHHDDDDKDTSRSSVGALGAVQLTPHDVAACTAVCVCVHESVERASAAFRADARRYNYVTPTSFLELLQTFRALLTSQSAASATTCGRLVNGLRKMRETEAAVATLQQTLAQSQPVLLEKRESIRLLVREMELQTAAAETTEVEAAKEREAVAAMQGECASIEQAAHEQLAEALPELDRALESLKNLKSSQITEVAGYKAPTPGVVMTMQGICILFQIKPALRAATALDEKKPDYWATAKEQLLGNPNALLQRLIHYDKEHIPERLIQAVRPLVSSDDFTPRKIAGASQACAAMCQWTHAMVRFHDVNRRVAPLRQRLHVAQTANRAAQTKLHAAEAKLRDVAATLAALRARKDAAEQEMRELADTVTTTELKLQRASALIDGLADEKDSWTRSLHERTAKTRDLVGDMLAAAAQIVYCGAFTAPYRHALRAQWRRALDAHHLAHSDQLALPHLLGDAVQMREWALHGLPTDAVSLENALIAREARRWPLMIDPQGQANAWVRATHADALEVLKPSQKDLVKRIEYCIRAGRPVLLEGVGESLDASLTPLLARQTFVQGGVECIRLGDHAVPYHARFRFAMTTKLPNPHYAPETSVRVTLLNFFITPHGLEEQLLGVVVGHERKELEQRRSDLVQKNAAMKASLAEMQRSILRKLEEVHGDVLDDVELIDYLRESKATTTTILARVAEAEAAEVEINASRERYRVVARRAAGLFFCVAALAAADPMYQYSLQWFVRLFATSIEHAARDDDDNGNNNGNGNSNNSTKKGSDHDGDDDLHARLRHVCEYVTYSLYTNVSRSLFEQHKLLFSFYLCISILRQEQQQQQVHDDDAQQTSRRIDDAELRFLIYGPSMVTSSDSGGGGGAATDTSRHGDKSNSKKMTRTDDDDDDNDGNDVAMPTSDDDDASWLTPAMWRELCYLATHFRAFRGLPRHIATHAAYYRAFFLSSDAHRERMHDDWPATTTASSSPRVRRRRAPLTPMQRLLFLRCLRPDKLMAAVQDFVTRTLGARYLRAPPFDLLTSYADSTATTPLIFILSQGADPYEDWRRFAESQQMGRKLHDISLGQGQGPRAERMLAEAMETGAWVLLQNCHLAKSWMPTLERLVENMTASGGGGSSNNNSSNISSNNSNSAIHPTFRLWLTSMPTSDFPVAVLQNAVKMTNEPPMGMQANVTRSLLRYTDDYFDRCRQPAVLRKLTFALCFFHALVQERRKFGPLGWNIAYEYTAGDLTCCVTQIRMFLEHGGAVPYTVIRELSGNIHYGGRVTDDWDRRTLTTLLEPFVHADVVARDDYRFTDSPLYYSLPATTTLSGYVAHVATWPLNTHPETFGLHENADMTCARTAAFDTLATMALLLQSDVTHEGSNDSNNSNNNDDNNNNNKSNKSNEGGEATPRAAVRTPDEVVLELAHVIRRRVRAPFDLDKLRERYPASYADSMNTVLVQEAVRFNRLLAAVHHTLDTLPLAIKGETLMSRDLEDAYRALYSNTVPAPWAQRAYPSLKPLAAWIDDLVQRLAMVQAWYEQGHPHAYWISGFFFPQAFLTGTLQNYARARRVSIDTIRYDFVWCPDVVDVTALTRGPDEGCYVYGMYIEGARIETLDEKDSGNSKTTMTTRRRCRLAESRPKVLFESTPVLWLRPVIVTTTTGKEQKQQQRQASSPSSRGNVYECPLYKTAQRAGTLSTTGHSTNFVLAIDVPTDVDVRHWVRRGVALLCALST